MGLDRTVSRETLHTALATPLPAEHRAVFLDAMWRLITAAENPTAENTTAEPPAEDDTAAVEKPQPKTVADLLAGLDPDAELGVTVGPIHVTRPPLKGQEWTILALALGLLEPERWPVATVAVLAPLIERVKRLKRDEGELCVVQALGETQPEAEYVTDRLNGEPCRYPRVGCRFQCDETGACDVDLEAVEATLAHLEKRSITRRENAVAPRWKVL